METLSGALDSLYALGVYALVPFVLLVVSLGVGLLPADA